MTPRRRPPSRLHRWLVLLLAGLFSGAQADELLVYLDLDASATTGCSATTAEGPANGVEQVLITRHQNSQVTEVVRRECINQTTDTFGPEISVSATGWPVGLGLGTSGSDVVETFVPLSDLGAAQPAFLVAFATRDAAGAEADAVLGPDAGGLLLQGVGPQSTVPVPSLHQLGLVLLAIMLAAVSLRGLRRHQGLQSFVMVLVLGGSLAGLVWAAIVVDGDPGDWAGIGPLSTDPTGDGGGSDLVAVFGRSEGGQLNFRADVFGVNDAPVLSPDTFTASFVEGGAAVPIADTITVSDPDDTQLASATVTVTNLQDVAAEILAADTTGTAIVAVYAAPVLSLTGTDSLANYQAVLRSVTYEDTAATPTLTPDRSITLVVNDGALDSNIATATTTIVHVNITPSFTPGADQTVLEDAGLQTVLGWATNIDDGDPTIVQTLTFNVSNDNTALFSQQPAIDATTGTLTYRPADNANGGATVTITLSDDGGTASGGVDTSDPVTFTMTVTPVNDVPSFTAGPDQTVPEDSGAQTLINWATAISAGPPDEAGQTLSFGVSNDTNALFAAQPSIDPAGNLSYTPAPDANGSATMTVTLSDDGGTADGGVDTSAAQTFTISVTAANDPPVANGQSVGTDEDTAVSITLTGSDPDGSSLTFAVATGPTNGSLGAITPLTSTSASVTYTPNLNYSGPDSFTFTVFDGGLNSTPATVSITANAVNDAPVAANHSFDTVGNTLLEAGLVPASTASKVSLSGRLFDNATDVDNPVPGALVASLATPVTAGAVVTVDSDGTFAYTPPPGQMAPDTFTYRLCNIGDTVNCSTGVVTVNLVDMVWYVKNDAAGGGLGRSTDPFDTLVEAQAAAAASQTIFVHTGNGAGTGQNAGITLLDNQGLIGQGVALSVPGGVNGNPGPTILLAAGVNPLISNAAGDTVTLAQNNTIAGLGAGDTPPSNMAFRHSGAGGAGTLTISNVSVSGTGGIIDLQNGAALSVSFDNLVSISSSGTAAIRLIGVGGTWTVSNPGVGVDTAISGAAEGISVQSSGGASFSFGETGVTSTGDAISLVDNANASFTFANLAIVSSAGRGLFATNTAGTSQIVLAGTASTIDTSGGAALDLTRIGSTGMTFDFVEASGGVNGIRLDAVSGSVTINSGAMTSAITATTGAAVIFQNSPAGVLSFADIVIDTSATNQTGLFASGNGGTGRLNLDAGSIDAGNARGVDIDNTVLGNSGGTGTPGLTLFSVTSTGGSAPGIDLDTTTGAFTVTGDGSSAGPGALDDNNGSGGAITSKTGDAIILNNATKVSLNHMNIGAAGGLGNIGGNGIRATGVSGLTLTRSNLQNIADQASPDEAALLATNPAGTWTIANCLFDRSFDDHVRIVNETTTGGLMINLTDSTLRDNNASGSGNDALLYIGDGGNTDATLVALGNDFDNSDGDHIQVALNGLASADVTIGGTNAGDGNDMTATQGAVSGSGISLSSGAFGGGFSGVLTYLVEGNDVQNPESSAINANLSVTSTAGQRYSGTVADNTVGTGGIPGSGGFGIRQVTNGAGTSINTIDNNSVLSWDGANGLELTARDGSNRLASTVANNIFLEPNPVTGNTEAAVEVASGAVAGDTSVICLDITDADVSGFGNNSFDVPTDPLFGDMFFGTLGGGSVELAGYGGAASNQAAIQSYVQTGNVGTPTVNLFVFGGPVPGVATNACQ